MALIIENSEAEAMARRLAESRQVSVGEIVEALLKAETEKQARIDGFGERIEQILQRHTAEARRPLGREERDALNG